MSVNVYEGMYIFDSNRYGRDAAKVTDQVTKMVEKAGGEILVSRLWEERRLAYPINGHRKGTYWLTYIRIEGQKLGDLSRECEISDDILRHLYIKIDDRLVDAVLAHAQGLGAATPEEGKDGATDDASSSAESNGEGENEIAEPAAVESAGADGN